MRGVKAAQQQLHPSTKSETFLPFPPGLSLLLKQLSEMLQLLLSLRMSSGAGGESVVGIKISLWQCHQAGYCEVFLVFISVPK